MAGLSPKTALRARPILLSLILLGLVSLSGCSETYPDDLKYPLRSDPIVDPSILNARPDKAEPTEFDKPGQLEQWIEGLTKQGAPLIDPTAGIEKRQLEKVNEFLGKNHFDLTKDEAASAGLVPPPTDADEAKRALTAKKESLTKRISDIDKQMKIVGPALESVLEEMFGRPASPKVNLPSSDDSTLDQENEALHKTLRLDDEMLKKGSKLYRRHCLHCHGLTGDGRGPTAPWVNPHPRDYRLGKFKFTSSFAGVGDRKARREDLVRTLQHGIEGTSMPSFGLLDRETEIEPLVSYVIHLSMRGEVEKRVLAYFLSADQVGDQIESKDVKDKATEAIISERRPTGVWKGWKLTVASPIVPSQAAPSFIAHPGALSDVEESARKKAIRHGFELFTVGKGACLKCHSDFGRANDLKIEDWGTIGRPANLTAGMYRGGRTPLDLFNRVYGGINGSIMTAIGGEGGALKDEDIWDVVSFLQAMPFRNMLPDGKDGGVNVREQIYVPDIPASKGKAE